MDREEIRYSGIGWIHLAQDRVHWCVFMDTVIKTRVLYKAGIS